MIPKKTRLIIVRKLNNITVKDVENRVKPVDSVGKNKVGNNNPDRITVVPITKPRTVFLRFKLVCDM
jgi:hypothetical protein